MLLSNGIPDASIDDTLAYAVTSGGPHDSGRKPQSILHIVRRYQPLVGGTERYVADLAVEQARRGSRVRVLTLDRDVTDVDSRRFPRHEEIEGVEVVRVPGFGNRRLAFALRPDLVVSALKAASVVHLHDLRLLFGTSVCWAFLAQRPLFFHTHGLIFHEPWGHRLKLALARGLFGPALMASRSAVVASSVRDRSLLLALAPYLTASTHLVENAIDQSDLRSIERRVIPGLLVFVGRVVASKGIDELLAMMAQQAMTGTRLIMIGPISADERRRVNAIIEASGLGDRVEISGLIDRQRLLAFLAQADIALFPSRAEGFGLALLESMAAGVPVLASPIPAHLALLGPQHRDQVIDFKSAQRAADAVTALLARDEASRRELGMSLQERATYFRIERLADQIEGLYAKSLRLGNVGG